MKFSGKMCLKIIFKVTKNKGFSHFRVKTVNDELIKINEWFSANKLSLNVGKVFIVPQIGKKIQHLLSSTNIKNDNHDIERVNMMKFLGVLLDNNLS